MSNYSKGSRGENELGGIFEEEGYVWIRAAGSGSGPRELPDIFVAKEGQLLAIEVKRWSNDVDYKYLSKEEVESLEWFAEQFGAEPWIFVRFDYGDWGAFLSEELKETKKSYRVDEFKEPERGVEDVIQ